MASGPAPTTCNCPCSMSDDRHQANAPQGHGSGIGPVVLRPRTKFHRVVLPTVSTRPRAPPNASTDSLRPCFDRTSCRLQRRALPVVLRIRTKFPDRPTGGGLGTHVGAWHPCWPPRSTICPALPRRGQIDRCQLDPAPESAYIEVMDRLNRARTAHEGRNHHSAARNRLHHSQSRDRPALEVVTVVHPRPLHAVCAFEH